MSKPRKVTRPDGSVVYEVVVDLGRDKDGRRRQSRRRFDTMREARDFAGSTRSQRADGSLVMPKRTTLDTYLDQWLAGRRDLRPTTLAGYREVLKVARAELGHVPLQTLTKVHVDRLVDLMQSQGGVKGEGRSPRTVRFTLSILSKALDDAVKQRLVVVNVVRGVSRPPAAPKVMSTWTAEQAKAYAATADGDRLAFALRLSLLGLRRGEVCGLTWGAVDLDAGTVTVSAARVVADGKVVDSGPKTAAGERTLPLPPAVGELARRLRTRQTAERLALGPGYVESGLVVVDETGKPWRPERYADHVQRLAKQAGVPVIRCHDLRHSSATLMHLEGVPMAVIAAWHGHADASFTQRTYAHSQAGALAAASDVLGRLHG